MMNTWVFGNVGLMGLIEIFFFAILLVLPFWRIYESWLFSFIFPVCIESVANPIFLLQDGIYRLVKDEK